MSCRAESVCVRVNEKKLWGNHLPIRPGPRVGYFVVSTLSIIITHIPTTLKNNNRYVLW